MNRQTRVKNKQESCILLSTVGQKSQNMVVESDPISHKNTLFKANYPLDDACFILETTMVVIISFFTEQMILIFSHCTGSLPDFFKVSVL